MAVTKKSKLLAVAPESWLKPKKPKILISGPAGVGKTWVSLDFPSVYYIDCEQGAERDRYEWRKNPASILRYVARLTRFSIVVGQIRRSQQKHMITKRL